MTGGGIQIQQESHIGPGCPHGDGIHRIDGSGSQSAADALINCGGVEKTVGYDPGPGFQCRPDDLPHQLGSAGSKEQEFRLVAEVLQLGRVLEEVPQALTEEGASRLPGPSDGDPTLLQRGLEQSNLGAFASALGTLKTDENASCHLCRVASMAAPHRIVEHELTIAWNHPLQIPPRTFSFLARALTAMRWKKASFSLPSLTNMD